MVRSAAFILVAALVLGCGGQQTQAPALPAAPQAKPGGAPAAPTPTPAAPKALQKITLVQSVSSVAFAPVYVALEKGFFKEEGLDVEMSIVQGGGDGAAMAAIAGGSAEFASTSSVGPIMVFGKEGKVQSIYGTAIKMTLDYTVSKQFAQKKGISLSSSEAEVVRALRGSTFGVASLGGGPQRYAEWLLRKHGFDPEKELTVTKVDGGPAGYLATLQRGSIDGFFLSPPVGLQAEQQGFGVNVLPAGKVPEFKVFVHEVITANRDYLQKNPDVARRFNRAMRKASDLVDQKPKEAATILKASFPSFSDDLILKSIDTMAGAFADQGRMTEAMWKSTVKVMLEAKVIDAAFDPKDGSVWTNQYNS